ncbi:hypothetical protein ACJA29_00380 [Metamycoplasma sualvi]|uniref:hypothetical protein n=1 Tax=Metamycoplasma sualvi TaxID=2125 RepID=UPI003872B2C7
MPVFVISVIAAVSSIFNSFKLPVNIIFSNHEELTFKATWICEASNLKGGE